MKNLNVCALFVILFSQAYAQPFPSDISPDVGWDSLKTLIGFPEIARRAGIQGFVDVSVYFDSLCNLSAVQVVGPEIFHKSVEEAIRKVKWTKNGLFSFRREHIYFTIEFSLKPYEIPKRWILHIEKDKAVVHKDYDSAINK